MDDDSIKSLFSLLEGGIKLFVACGAVCYGFGFVTVAVHYSRYNVTSLSLLNTEYVVAGLLTLLPLGILSAITLGFYFRLSEKKEGCLKRLSIVLGGLVVLVLILAFLLRDNFTSWTVELFIIIILVNALFFYIMLKSLVDDSRESRSMAYVALFYSIPALFIYTLLFSYYIYPEIPRGIGGGRPTNVRFALREVPVAPGSSPANAETGQSSPPNNLEPSVLLERDGTNSRVTIGYKLLLATDKTYVIQQPSNDKSTYEFPKDAVVGVVFYSE